MNNCPKELPLISVIIPIYNVENYLERCLSSLQNQTYGNLEVLLIDDGSKDSSGEIADAYAKQDSRFKAFHLTNNGVSSARNYGIKMFTGEYVTFIDADDFVDVHYIEFLYQAIIDTQSKMSVCQMYECGNDVKAYEEVNMDVKPTVYTIDENYDYTASYARFSVCATLFKRELIEKRKFSTELFMGEDALFVAEVMNECKKYALIQQKLYVYILYNQSSSHGKYTEKHRTEVYAMQKIKEVYNIKSTRFVSNMNARYCFVCLNGMKQMILYDVNDEEWYSFLHNEVRENIIPFLKSQYAFSRKVIAVMFCILPRVIKYVYKNVKKFKA